MVQIQTKLYVADNSGARFARCIYIYSKNKNKIGIVNDELLVSVIKCYSRRNTRKKMRKGHLYRAILIRTKNFFYQFKPGPLRFCFRINSIVLLSKRLRPVGSRIYGPILQKIRLKTYYRLIQLAPIII